MLMLMMLIVFVLMVPTPGNASVHLILWGRCYSYCLRRHLQERPSLRALGEKELDTLPKNPIRACQRHITCRWCLYVCERPESQFTNSSSCHRDCRHTRTQPGSTNREACVQACHFVERAAHVRGGTCPAPGSLRGFQTACVASCQSDGDCGGRASDKCCSNDCGRVCVEPADVKILPPIPKDLRFKMLKTGGVLISWDSSTVDSGNNSNNNNNNPQKKKQQRRRQQNQQQQHHKQQSTPRIVDTPNRQVDGGGGGRDVKGDGLKLSRGDSTGSDGGGGDVGDDVDGGSGQLAVTEDVVDDDDDDDDNIEGDEDDDSVPDIASPVLLSLSPAVYIFRWWCPYTSGAVTSVTDRSFTRVQGYPEGIYPGSRCHFMVAAVNLHGSRGFSTVSPYTKQFLLPSPPLNLDEVRSQVHDGKVDVTIQWQPPVYTDGLPVYRYQVFWSDSLPRASANYMRLHMHRRVLSADRHSFVLQSLKMGTIYFVQVRAVVRWKTHQKVGKPASTYIETYAPPHQASGVEELQEGGQGGAIIEGLQVNQTFYDHTVLKTHITWELRPGKSAHKYLIYWKADMCAGQEHNMQPTLEISATSHSRSFTLFNLKPQCEYSVRVRAVMSRDRTGAATVTNFITPSCHLIPVRQGDSPDCHTSETPDEVRGLHAETTSCITVIRWQPPLLSYSSISSSSASTSPSTPHLRGYEVVWGRTEAEGFSASTVIYTSEPRSLTVPANTTHVALGLLKPGDHYTVQVRGVGQEGTSGPPALLPLLVPHTDHPCVTPASSSSSSSSSSPLSSSTKGQVDADVTTNSPKDADDVSAKTSNVDHLVDDTVKNVSVVTTTSQSSSNPAYTTNIGSENNRRDVTAVFVVTDDDEDGDVFFSGDRNYGGTVNSGGGTVLETEFEDIPGSPGQSQENEGGAGSGFQTHHSRPSGTGSWTIYSQPSPKKTPVQGSYLPGNTPVPSAGEQDSDGGGGRVEVKDSSRDSGSASSRTCWWTLVTSLLTSVLVCERLSALCFLPKS